LVLNWGDSSLLPPVPASWKLWVVDGSVVSWDDGGLGSKVESAELLDAEVSKLVHGDGEGLVGVGVVSVHKVQVCLEGSEAVQELIMVIRFLVLLHPEGESGLVLDLREGKSSACKQECHDEGLHVWRQE